MVAQTCGASTGERKRRVTSVTPVDCSVRPVSKMHCDG